MIYNQQRGVDIMSIIVKNNPKIIEKISMTGSKTHDLKAASEILQTPSHLKKVTLQYLTEGILIGIQ